MPLINTEMQSTNYTLQHKSNSTVVFRIGPPNGWMELKPGVYPQNQKVATKVSVSQIIFRFRVFGSYIIANQAPCMSIIPTLFYPGFLNHSLWSYRSRYWTQSGHCPTSTPFHTPSVLIRIFTINHGIQSSPL